jgi:predicted nucleic acid-binding protein
VGHAALSERHYWDTCAWFDLLEEPPPPATTGPMRTMWGMVERGGLEVLFSPITLTECLFRADGQGRPYADPHASDELFNAGGMVLVQVDRMIGERSRTLRRLHNLKAPDAIHLACAIEHNVDHFVTRDKLKLPTLYRKDGRPLTISTPSEVLMGPLGAGREA